MCGIIGIAGTENASTFAAVGLHQLQHRGQEGVGIVSWDGAEFHEHREGGLVGHVCNGGALAGLPGHAAIGQVLYSTSEGAEEEKRDRVIQKRVQPFIGYFPFGPLVIAHNGNITNARTLYRTLLADGRPFQTNGIDTEVALQLIGSTPGETLVARLTRALPKLEGAYSLIMLSQKKLIGVRDPLGVRPLFIGRVGTGFVFASETCALEDLQATGICEVAPGEIIVVENGRLYSHVFAHQEPKPCAFEYIYLSRPDSTFGGASIDAVRVALGRELAREAPILADLIVPVPASGISAGEGYAAELAIPFTTQGIIRNHYNWRSFIEEIHDERKRQVKLKHSPNHSRLRGMRIGLCDDSLVRAVTATRVVGRCFDAGAREVHLRIPSPPWRYGCYWGIDEKEPDRRLAQPSMTVEEVCLAAKRATGATSVAFLSIAGMRRAFEHCGIRSFCSHCFTGERPTPISDLALLH